MFLFLSVVVSRVSVRFHFSPFEETKSETKLEPKFTPRVKFVETKSETKGSTEIVLLMTTPENSGFHFFVPLNGDVSAGHVQPAV
jgi:hypothetical protein